VAVSAKRRPACRGGGRLCADLSPYR
jgi:hypothetical protein